MAKKMAKGKFDLEDFAKQLTNSFLGCAGVNYTGVNPLWPRLRINDQTIIEFMELFVHHRVVADVMHKFFFFR